MISSEAEIVLVGGFLTTEDGAELDSRQKVEGDEPSEVMRKSLASSWLWWSTVQTLTLPILDAAGPGSFALVIGERSVYDLRPDGSFRRIALKGLLSGGAGTIEVTRVDRPWDVSSDEGEFKGLVVAAQYRASTGQIGISGDTDGSSRWRFYNGNDFYMTHVGPRINPAVIIDTSNYLSAPFPEATDSGFSGPSSFYKFGRLQSFEERRLFGKAVVIMPHTAAVESALDEYVGWTASGRPPAAPVGVVTLQSAERPQAEKGNPVRYARLVPVSADFRVTGYIRDKCWKNPDDLEAARSLLASRFDLTIGLWDLVNNPLLRTTLLNSTPAAAVPHVNATILGAAEKRAQQAVKRKRDEEDSEATALDRIRIETAALTRHGWTDGGRNYFMCLPLTAPMTRWPVRDGWPVEQPSPLVTIYLGVSKRQTSVTLVTSMYNDVDLRGYVRSRQEQINEIAGCDLDQGVGAQAALWRSPGGWGDAVDWVTRFADLAERTPRWIEVFRELSRECTRIRNARS